MNTDTRKSKKELEIISALKEGKTGRPESSDEEYEDNFEEDFSSRK